MLPFRQYHLYQLFANIEKDKGPLDLTLSRYFRENTALGSKDRKSIASILYQLVRWSGLYDYFIEGKKTWQARHEAYQKINLEEALQDNSIPLHIRYSFPKIILDKWIEAYGEQKAVKLAYESNQRAPITIRINTLKISRAAFMQQYKEEFEMTPCLHSTEGVQILKRTSLFQTRAFKEGLFEMQDEASQLIASLVQAKAKEKVLDFCSGSGGKSLAIAPNMNQQGVLYLHDIRPQILIQAKKRLKRAGVQNAQILDYDDAKFQKLEGKFDWILVDAPCSGSGTYRRNPDLKWKFTNQMLEELIEQQRAIFDSALGYLKPGGKIVYATCSLFKEENEDQMNYFIQKYGLKVDASPLNSSNLFEEMDGFFGVVFKY